MGRRQVQNVLGELTDSGYVRVVREGGPGQARQYEFAEDAGLADVKLPTEGTGDDTEDENSRIDEYNTQNFVSDADEDLAETVIPTTTAEIPATADADAASSGPPPS